MAGSLSFGRGHAMCEARIKGIRCGGTSFWIQSDGSVVCQKCKARHVIRFVDLIGWKLESTP